jgi:hypothetical protein
VTSPAANRKFITEAAGENAWSRAAAKGYRQRVGYGWRNLFVHIITRPSQKPFPAHA